jgi:hypothetical protein
MAGRTLTFVPPTRTIPRSLASRPSARNAVGHRVGVAVLTVLSLAGLAAWLYLVSVHAGAPNSDGATVVLEGQAMASGHVLLDGWRLSYDSFWSVDAPVYALAVLVDGVHPALLHLVPAILAAGLVVFGAFMARGGRRGVAGLSGAATVVVLLALPSHALAEFLLFGPLHIGTTLWCLIAFAALMYLPTRWGVPLAAVVLAAGLLGDLQTAALGVAPVAAAGLVAAARARRWRPGLPALVTAASSAVLAVVVRLVTVSLGTYTMAPSTRASRSEIVQNLRAAPDYLARLLGVGSAGFGTGGSPAALDATHVVGLAAVAGSVAMALFRLGDGVIRGGDADGPGRLSLDDLLVIGAVCDVAMFAYLSLSASNVTYARYLVPGVVFAVVLTGKTVAGLTGRPRTPGRAAMWVRRGLAGVSGALAACFLATVVAGVASAAPATAQQPVADFLAAHHLDRGIGDYWTSSIITVESSEGVTVRPVRADTQGRLVGYNRQSSSAWYTGDFQFLVYNVSDPYDGVDETSAAASFGTPAATYLVSGYEVLVWSEPVAVVAGP